MFRAECLWVYISVNRLVEISVIGWTRGRDGKRLEERRGEKRRGEERRGEEEKKVKHTFQPRDISTTLEDFWSSSSSQHCRPSFEPSLRMMLNPR
jgi:hypothetical protein